MSEDEASGWRTIEADEFVIIVADWSEREVLVFFDTERKVWACYECPRSPKATTTCAHVQAAVRDLDFSILLRIASVVHRPDPPSRRSKEDRAAERTVTDALARSAERRAERARAHDERHARLPDTVTTRKASASDHRKIEETRRRRARGTSPWAQM
ncbi:hypothetical protein Q9S36_29455 [Microbacterium sp. ARD31]|uniref:hypothetical protein n=1 Tax=Microbacterium sp. ARD31 TaxID=2962576 RepID=UPI0028820471|nr:hypothetical protein [Microbacterium sp. ARD31]MDT0184329.1 hypothetical protein [Microbacterium sp. ARD31]